MKKRVLSFILALTIIMSIFPMSVFAAHDSTGRPIDLTGDVYLALYTGKDFPGEPAEHDVSGYLNLNKNFESPGFTIFADSAEGILKEQILDDVVQGTSGVWGVFSTTGGSKYLLPESGMVNEDGSHNAEVERKIIQTAIDNKKFSLPAGESIDNYTIVWYIIKYQRSDSAWHIDGLITKKSTYSVNYYGNGNTSGAAPTGKSGLLSGDQYTVLGNTGALRKTVGRDTYIFNGWNTKSDGTGEHYNNGDVITIKDSDVTLYAEWFLQNKYTVTVVTKLDDNETNVEEIFGEQIKVYIKSDLENAEYIELEKSVTGTYTTTVTDNATYYVYFEDAEGNFVDTHGHKVVIYNQNGRTELLHYSVNYDTDGGNWNNGEDPGVTYQHANTTASATTFVPKKAGYKFVGWKDQNGNDIQPGGVITDAITEKTVLTAQWEKLVNVTVNVNIDHTPKYDQSAGRDNSNTKGNISFQLMETDEDGVNTPIGDIITLTPDDYNSENYSYSYNYDAGSFTTTYTAQGYTFENVEAGTYTVTAPKHHYEYTVETTTDENGNITINIDYRYTPSNFDLDFDVVVKDWENIPEDLKPQAANIRVMYWGYNEEGNLGWHVITQQIDGVPVTVDIGEDGTGRGFYPVWKYIAADDGTIQPYYYRIAVSSFVMPDGSVMRTNAENNVVYTAGIYKATVEILPDGNAQPPLYPETGTDLEGVIYVEDEDEQNAIPTATVEVNPYKVTFVAGDGTINGQSELVLDSQYKYPDISKYKPVPNDENDYFTGWYDENGNPAENFYGNYLTGDVTYYAQYSLPMSIQGTVNVHSSYIQDGQIVEINPIDRAQNVMVVLQKNINGVYNDVDKRIVPITYVEGQADGTGTYSFDNIPNDGIEYRIQILVRNYNISYDNESDADISYSKDEYTAILGNDNIAVVDAHLENDPDLYVQKMEVDASRIAIGFRPNSVLSEIVYRDLGDIHQYNTIAQHKVEPFGVPIDLDNKGQGNGEYSVWEYHTNGGLYEYQMDITKVFGTVDGVYTAEGTKYNSDTAPYVIEYGPASRYSAMSDGQLQTLKATLVPKEYEIRFDVGVDVGQVQGMSEYLTDGADGSVYYSYLHIWSFQDKLTAFPYRNGYVFKGWKSNHEGVVVNDQGHITVGATVAQDVTLTAVWEKLEGTSYTVRHLELNTENVLIGAVTVENVTVGTVVKAVDAVQDIKGYNYAGAKIGDIMYNLNEEPVLTVVDGPYNLITIYYTKDGYTDQVESNLKLDKTAVLEDNGTYTINMETHTKDNPVTTLIQQNTPLDIVLVIDQSGSIKQGGYLDELQSAVDNFVTLIADHGRHNGVDHRVALVGYAGDEDCDPTSTNTNDYPLAGGTTSEWINTGVFDSNGDFHPYTVTGFNYTKYTGSVNKDGVYYAYSHGEYLLLSYHETYHHLITEEDARIAILDGETVYGYVYDENDVGGFVELTRNTSGLWLYGDKKLYSSEKFFTYHTDVWTHRHGLEYREIHAYGTGDNYKCTDGHGDVYTRTETKTQNPQLNIFRDALIPVSFGANGSGRVNPNLIKSTQKLGSNGGTYVQYGVEMANKIFEQNPLDENSDRVRIMVMFTDGMPGETGFDTNVANSAISQAYITKNTHKALSYTIGLYKSTEIANNSNEEIYMNAVSSNYPKATDMESVKDQNSYTRVTSGKLNDGNTYYVKSGDSYYQLKYGRVSVSGSIIARNRWYYTIGSTNYNVSTSTNPNINSLSVQVYKKQASGLAPTEYSGYYSTTDSEIHLVEYFQNVMTNITTNITKEIVLHEDTILRDIMGQGLVLTPGSVVTAYKQAGKYNSATGEIDWSDEKEYVAQVTIPENNKANILYSSETTAITYFEEDGTEVTKDNVPYISVFNLTAENATDPNKENYHPHTIDITGYDFENWYINDTDHTEGYKMVVEVTRIEATDDVEWGRSTSTNNEMSGLWLPADKNGERQLLLPFDQPSTIFVERAYVLDYGKEFTLSGWYFDSNEAQTATPLHIDSDIESGMNWFHADEPSKSSGKNLNYGNATIRDGKVHYQPTTTNWGGYDQYYVFGNTWRKTVQAQDANQNGNLWNKVVVIPANNIYYEDSFITTEDSDINGISGFKFTGSWETIYSDDDAGSNVETPEHQENDGFGEVHGWTDSLGDDTLFTDGSAHGTGLNGGMGASVEFTFTGTAVEVYTRTNSKSGMVFAMLTSHTKNDDGSVTDKLVKSFAIDNLSASGDYYHIPTVSFEKLAYGTYTVKIIATAGVGENGAKRCEYYVDGIRVYNPLGNTTNYLPEDIKDAYGNENNAVFTTVRDILLEYGDFTGDLEDTETEYGKLGAIFIDQIKEGQTDGSNVGEGQITYDIGTFEKYGPKNEVYLSSGQAIVIKVDANNTYYVGLKSLTGGSVVANVSGVTMADPTSIVIEHTTDMYYRVTPIDGYIVIQNGSTDGSILSITNLRTTNHYKAIADGGVMQITKKTALMFMSKFMEELANVNDDNSGQAVEKTQPEESAEKINEMTQELFGSVRTWLQV